MKKIVLGINIDDVTMNQVIEIAEGWLSKPGKHYIVTPNPEILVMAQDDRDLKEVINNADLAIPDGVGLKLTGDIVMTTPGIDVMEGLIKMAEEKGFTVGFLGGRGEVAAKIAECLRKKYPKLKISFADSGGEVDENGKMLSDYRLPTTAEDGSQKTVDLLFVAFGPPKQEKWIAKNLSKLPVKVAMGVGGAFDYLSGKVPRAPIWIRNLGFEWLFRLCLQPWRIKRQSTLIRYLYLLLRG